MQPASDSAQEYNTPPPENPGAALVHFVTVLFSGSRFAGFSPDFLSTLSPAYLGQNQRLESMLLPIPEMVTLSLNCHMST